MRAAGRINFLFYPRLSTFLLTRRSFPPKRHNTRSSVWMFWGFSLFSTSTAQALVAVRGPAVTYGLLKFTPLIESHATSLDISGFTIRRGSEKFTLQDIPVSQILPEQARSDIVIRTYKRDDDARSTYFENEFEIQAEEHREGQENVRTCE